MSRSRASHQGQFLETAGQNIVKDTTIHTNLGQQVIIITEDKLELALRDYEEAALTQKQWIGPLSLSVTLLLVFATSNFGKAFGFGANTWEAFFLILTIASVSWCIRQGFVAYQNRTSLDDLVSQIKKESKKAKDTANEEGTVVDPI